MSRLLAERLRLYLMPPAPGQDRDDTGHCRALVLELSRPADWQALGTVWRGVQEHLGWPAPAIAVSGDEGLQLWFSLAQAVSTPAAHALLQALGPHFLPEVPAHRLRLWPDPAAPERTLPRLPEQVRPEQWSAFVSPDLAPVFADTPWLDIAPGEDGQAERLRPLQPVSPAEWQQALAVLGLQADGTRQAPPAASPAPSAGPAGPAQATAGPPAAPEAASDSLCLPDLPQTDDPRAFLQAVMRHPQAPVAQRVAAARALLGLPN
ncbi:hypothetical protein [Ideonella livida]|uniref:Uncharacterized protein n=1 Tax=Ideonella livida TaxID=2707176 RepID=A0A7C9PGA9_9BURK|nr:hypothetical protein [Ideonella livida]NDY90254.1 hypothetical protein [Ideonella livida]